MLYPVGDVGKYGVIADRAAHELPTNTWTDCENVRFRSGFAEKMKGQVQVFGALGCAPIFALSVNTDAVNYWVYAGEEKVYCWDGGSHTNITRQTTGADVDYNTDLLYGWTGGVLSGVAILNNGIDAPQMWYPPSAGTKLSALANWPANTTCGAIRVFKQFLIAVDITRSGTRYPHSVLWSHPADPGAVPSSWDIADPTKLAGESPALSETPGFAVDGCALRDTFILYKEDSVWGMQLINATDVFRFYKIFNTGGIISTNCAVEFFNGKHAVFGISDIYQHDGQQMKSIVSDKVRTRIYGNLEGSMYRKCFVAHNVNAREVWFCYPTSGSTDCNEALVWNYEMDTIGFRVLPQATFIATGIVNPGSAQSDQWRLDSASWNDDTTIWGARLYNPTQFNLLMTSRQNSKIYIADFSNSFEGSSMPVSLERTGIALPYRSSQPPDTSYRKFIRAVWVRITGTNGEKLRVSVGGQEDSFSSVDWQTVQEFTIGESARIDCRVSGRLFAIKFESEAVMQWQLHGYEIEYETMGRY